MSFVPPSIAIEGTTNPTTWDANSSLLGQFTNYGIETLVQETGIAIATMEVDTMLATDTSGAVTRMAQLELGCISEGLKIGFTPTNQEFAHACKRGKLALPTGGDWAFSGTLRKINPVLFAGLTGLTIIEPVATHPIQLYIKETLVASASNALTLSHAPVAVRSMKRQDTDYYFHEIGLGDTVDAETFTISGVTAQFYTTVLVGDIVEVEYIYESTTAVDGLVLKDIDSNGMPSTFDIYVTWLAINAKGKAQGRVIAKCSNITNTGEIGLGGANQQVIEIALTGIIGSTPVLYWQEFS